MEISDYKTWYKNHKDKLLEDFFTYLRFPSISTDPVYRDSVMSCANFLLDYLKKMGLQSELLHSSGYPAVFASHLVSKNRPTLLIYHHYDVQPVDPIELWKSDPFQPKMIKGEVFARGASDNKGQCFYTLCALRAFLEIGTKEKINIKIFIEGEEESGGKGTGEILLKHADKLKADYLLIVDSGIPEAGKGAITLGVRGICTMEVTCENAKVDLHSGTHGGIALNPIHALISALAKMWDENRKIMVPEFYEDILPISREEMRQFDLEEIDLDQYKSHFGVRAFAPESGYSLIESSVVRPTLEINGIAGGYAGPGFKTVIPKEASAKISCRLVPDQDPDKIAKDLFLFLRSKIPATIQMKWTFHHGAKSFRSSGNSKIAKVAKIAYEEVLKSPCRNILMGGSIPIAGDLTEVSGAKTILIGYSLDSDNFHAPNEHFGLDRIEQGFLTMTKIFSLLATDGLENK
ncbi:MAG: dipeptidase [Chlamydiae bacterium]|nr:dipeptidase [Chlamydiota bacterium]